MLLHFAIIYFGAHAKSSNPTARITITGHFGKDALKENTTLQFVKTKLIGMRSVAWEGPWQDLPGEMRNGVIKWELQTPEAIRIKFNGLSRKGIWFLIEPGDSIQVKQLDDDVIYSGRGSKKFNLLEELNHLSEADTKPVNEKFYKTRSLEDYLEWSNYLNMQKEQVYSILQKYSDEISPYAFDYIKASFISEIEAKRIIKFVGMYGLIMHDSALARVLPSVYDLTIPNKDTKWLNELNFQNENTTYYYNYVNAYERRKYGFKNYPLRFQDEQDRHWMYYDAAKLIYSGENLYACLAYILTEKVIRENVFSKFSIDMMEDFRQIDMPDDLKNQYITYVKKYTDKIRTRSIRLGIEIPDFNIETPDSRKIVKKNWLNKTILFNFLDPKKYLTENDIILLTKLQVAFADNPHVIIANMLPLARKADWKRITGLQRLSSNNIYFYDDQRGSTIKDFDVHTFPTSYLVNNRGLFVESPFNYFAPDKNKSVIQLITEQLDLSYDGPYLRYEEKDSLSLISVTPNGIDQIKEYRSKEMSFSVQTGQRNRPIHVKLKQLPDKEPSVYNNADKLLAISDIEGNFSAFQKLLISNNVVDSTLNWTFGKGHLVLIGDFFDRGGQVTECLWLIYSLEEKARSAGGHVHFILGNHEIMNLSGDHRYIHEKYKHLTKGLNVTYRELFNEKTELGQWLRTKNIIEKIDDYLFVHGGISPQINQLPLSLEQINEAARIFYTFSDSAAQRHSDPTINTLYHSYKSPFWYRNYYKEDHFSETYQELFRRATNEQLDSTMKKFGVNYIITGHTIVADTVSLHYGAKVINVDTPHKNGKSEGLLIEGKSLFRVNTNGTRYLLFTR